MIYTLIHKNADNVVDVICTFDAVLSASESWSGSVSKHTVEAGFPISSHINVENPVFDLSLRLSAYSVFQDGAELVWKDNDFTQSAEVDAYRHINAKDDLTKYFESRYIFTLLISENNTYESEDVQVIEQDLKSGYFKEHENCVITSLGFDQSNGTSTSFNVTMKLEKLNVAKVVFTQLTEDEKQRRIVPVKQRQATSSAGKASGEEADLGIPKDTSTKSTDAGSVVKKEPKYITDKKAEQAREIAIHEKAVGGTNTYDRRNQVKVDSNGDIIYQEGRW